MGTNLIKTYASLPSFRNKMLPIRLKPLKYICSQLHYFPIPHRVVSVLNWVFVIFILILYF